MYKIAWLAVLSLCPPAFGWGTEGHALIARIAELQLTPRARDQVAAILGPGVTLASVASWADDIRKSRPETGAWHYIDIPITSSHLVMARDCPQNNCVLAKIQSFEAIVADSATPAAQRREALLFLVHFIGDVHQPLHASNNQDHGGNTVAVQFAGRRLNLHSLWDSALLRRMGTEQELEASWARASAKHASRWSKDSVETWVEQSHAVCRKIVYRRLPHGTPAMIDAAYEKPADAVIREQIQKAGARLAATLNRALR